MTPEEALNHVEESIRAGRLGQAYIVVGPPRTEGIQLAESILCSVFCRDSGSACGKCEECKRIRTRSHPDVLMVEPELKSRQIAIAQIRAVQKRIYQTTYSSEWKACVVVSADRITDQAANAFLKTLEEPPRNTLFLLLTDKPQYLLPTVRSRCRTIALSGYDFSVSEEWESELAQILSLSVTPSKALAFGVADRLVGLLGALKKIVEKEESEKADAIGEDVDKEVMDARVSARYREQRTGIMRFVLAWYRDILVLVCGGGEGDIICRDYMSALKAAAANASYRRALDNLREVELMDRRFEQSVPEATVCNLGFSVISGA